MPPTTATRAAEGINAILVYVGSNPDDAIGENILKLPFLRVLKSAFPDARLTWIAGVGPCQFQGILAQLVDGMIDECLTDFRIDDSAKELLLRWRPMPGRGFDMIIDAQRNAVRTLVLRRIPHRLFISGCWRYFFSDVKPPEELVHPRLLSDRLLGLAAAATGEIVRTSGRSHLNGSMPPRVCYRAARRISVLLPGPESKEPANAGRWTGSWRSPTSNGKKAVSQYSLSGPKRRHGSTESAARRPMPCCPSGAMKQSVAA